MTPRGHSEGTEGTAVHSGSIGSSGGPQPDPQVGPCEEIGTVWVPAGLTELSCTWNTTLLSQWIVLSKV